MSKIRFLNVPRKVRSTLNGRRFTANSKALDLITANQKIKVLAKTLSTDQKINCDLEIEPDQAKQVFTVSNIYIEHADEQLGLRGIADRIALDPNVDEQESKNRLQLADLIESELKDEEPDNQDLGSDVNYLFTDEKENQREQSEKKESDQNEKEKSNDQCSIRGVAPKDTSAETSIQRSSSPDSKTTNHETTVESPSKVTPNPASFISTSQTKENTKMAVNLTKSEQEVIAKSDYVAAKNLFQAVPDKDVETAFDLQVIKKRLGYSDNPQDKYQRKLNQLIDRDLENCHLKNAASDFAKAENKLKQTAINHLKNSYDEVNQALLTETVAGLAGNDLKENQGAANQEKADTEQDALDKKDAKLKELQDEAARRIAEASDRINTEIKHREDTFNQEQKKWVEKRKNQIDAELKQKNQATKEKYRAKEIQKRNAKLQDIHQQVENSYSDNLDKIFTRHQNTFATNLVHLERSVQTQSSQIERQKRKDNNKQQMLNQQQAKISAINRLNQLKEQELKYRKKHDQQYPEDFAKTLSSSVSKAIKEALADQQQAAEKGEKLDLEAAIAKHVDTKALVPVGQFEVVSPQDEPNDKQPTKSSKKVIGIVGGVLIATLLAAGGYELYAEQTSNPTLSELATGTQVTKKANTVGKLKLKAKAIKTVKQDQNKKATSKVITHKKKKASVQAGDSNVIRYHSTNSWSAKIDVLDGALGQGDIRALKEINDYHSTWISRLYYAIAANDQAKIRSIYLQITPVEKQELSAAAKHAIALAFYNVKDWNNGWKARNGY
ncbi:hypothetical protein PT287_09610 [Lactobacillus sp. ESL0679]|uniref:hypothetical protein n=1 Tax=Lactobacillus sp. ESL0679 TaxID=2983209 RepID=UPI0023F98974|nr:hypothetical protein [Lactobacillus sp. ESL0679]MDF7683753.1 hypothetical protein [Lactobacillus sp. ESL0679]